jgi:hypothetical protein
MQNYKLSTVSLFSSSWAAAAGLQAMVYVNKRGYCYELMPEAPAAFQQVCHHQKQRDRFHKSSPSG